MATAVRIAFEIQRVDSTLTFAPCISMHSLDLCSPAGSTTASNVDGK